MDHTTKSQVLSDAAHIAEGKSSIGMSQLLYEDSNMQHRSIFGAGGLKAVWNRLRRLFTTRRSSSKYTSQRQLYQFAIQTTLENNKLRVVELICQSNPLLRRLEETHEMKLKRAKEWLKKRPHIRTL